MKSKVTDPEFLAQLTATAYKSRLNADLENLARQEDTNDDNGSQSFFINTEHIFAGEKTGEVLFVIGLTPVWKDFIKTEIKEKKNPNVSTGTCYKGLGKTLNFNLCKGRAKPAAIEKAFKKKSALKDYTLVFTVTPDEEELVNEDVLFAGAKPTDKSGKQIVDAIKVEMDIFRKIPVAEQEERSTQAKKIVALIDQWQAKHPKPAGTDIELAKRFQELEDSLLKVKANSAQKGNTAELLADIVTEFKDIQNMDWNNMREKDAQSAKTECEEVLEAIRKFETATLDNNNADINAQKIKVAQIKVRTEELYQKATLKLANKDFMRDSVLMSPTAFLQTAGVALKDDSDFANIVKELEAIQTETNKDGLTLDGQIAAANKTMRSDTDFTAIELAIETKITRLRNLAATANKWLKEVGNASSLIKALSKESRDRNERKKTAIATLLTNINDEIKNTQLAKTIAAKTLAKTTSQVTATLRVARTIGNIQPKLDKIKTDNPNFTNQQLAEAYTASINGKDVDTQNALYALLYNSKGGKLDPDEKTDALLSNFDSIITDALSLNDIGEPKNKDAHQQIAFIFRGESLFAAATTELFNEVDESMAAEVLESIEALAQNENTSLELDPNYEPDTEKRTKNAKVLIKILNNMLKQFSGKAAADRCNPKIVKFCQGLHQKCVAQNVPLSQIIILIGSTIVLRYINPLITNLQARFSDKANQRGFKLLAAALQKAVNKTNYKEDDFMFPLIPTLQAFTYGYDIFVKSILDILTPEEKQQITDATNAKAGSLTDRLKYVQSDITSYLLELMRQPSSKAYQHLYDFAVKGYNQENIDYYQKVLTNQHRTFEVFNQYLSPKAPNAINVETFNNSFDQALADAQIDTTDEKVVNQFLQDAKFDALFESANGGVWTNITQDIFRRFSSEVLTKDNAVAEEFCSLI